MKKDYSSQNNKKKTIKIDSNTQQVSIKNITHIKCDGYVSTVFIKDKEPPLNTKRLLKLYEIELAELGFFRANRNTLVNLKHVKCVECSKSNILTLITDEKIPISCRNLTKIKRILLG